MSDNNGKPNSSEKPNDLKALEARLDKAQARHTKSVTDQKTDGSLLGMAWRLSTELVVAVLVGAGLGFGLDKLFNTQPWLLIVGLGFGFAAGIKNTLRVAEKMDAQTAHIPLGDDIQDDNDAD